MTHDQNISLAYALTRRDFIAGGGVIGNGQHGAAFGGGAGRGGPFLQNPEMSKGKAMKSRLISLVLLVAFTIPLYAQMKAEKTEPAANSMNNTPPKQIQIWFNEAPVYAFTKINLTGPTGGVKLAALVFDGKLVSSTVVGVLPDGAYVATWQSAGNDGRVQRGQFKFGVKTR